MASATEPSATAALAIGVSMTAFSIMRMAASPADMKALSVVPAPGSAAVSAAPPDAVRAFPPSVVHADAVRSRPRRAPGDGMRRGGLGDGGKPQVSVVRER